MNTVDKIVKSKLAEYSTEKGEGVAATTPRQTKTYSWKSVPSGQNYAPPAMPTQRTAGRLDHLAELPWPEKTARYTPDDWTYLTMALANHITKACREAGLVSKLDATGRIVEMLSEIIPERMQHLDPEDWKRRDITVGSKGGDA